MQEITVYDSNGNSITGLVQWDTNVYIYVINDNIKKAYRVHFFNNTMNESYVVESTYDSGKLKAKIPNDLLKQPFIITGYIDVVNGDEEKCLYGFKINVRKKPKPSNLLNVDSHDYIAIEDILQECKDFSNSAKQSATAAKKSEENAKSSADKAEAIAQTVSEEIDGVTIVDTDGDIKYFSKFRIINGYPAIEITKL